jgi:hypothetical protein
MSRIRQPLASVSSNLEPLFFKGYADWEVDDFVYGTYVRTYEREYKKGKTVTITLNHVIRVIETSLRGELVKDSVVVETDIDLTNRLLVLNGMGLLNATLEKNKIAPGMEIEFIYKGKKADKNDPDTKYHQAEITIGPSTFADVEGVQTTMWKKEIPHQLVAVDEDDEGV